ncbi:tetratricopeptide repeat protein [Cetobacterium ceti]
MKKIVIFIGAVLLSSQLMASQKEDLNFLEQLYKQGKYNIAIDESQNFINKYPDSKYNKNIIIRLGKTYYFEGDYKNSIKFLQLALTKDPSDDEKNDINLYLMRDYAGLNDYKTAYEKLNLIEKDSDYYQKALLDLGNHYLDTGKYVEAQDELIKLVKLDPKGKYYKDGVISLALSSYNNSQYVKTIVYLDTYYKGDSKDRNYPLTNYLYGSSYYKINEPLKAKGYFKKVIDLYGNSTYGKKARLTMIELDLKDKNVQLAQEGLEKLKGTSEEGEAFKLFGDYYVVEKDYNKALSYYGKIIKSNRSDINYGYAFTLYKLGREKESLTYFNKLKGTKFYKQSVYYIFAIYYKDKNYKWVVNNRNLINNFDYDKEDIITLRTIIGNSALETKNYKIARVNYLKVYGLKGNKENLYRVIIGEAKAGSLEDMEKAYKDYYTKYPDDTTNKKNIYLVVGERYYNEKELPKAEALYKSYIEKDRDTTVLSNLISVLLDEKKYDEVITLLNSMDVSNENIYLKGIASMGMGKYEEAEKYFQELNEKTDLSNGLKEKVAFNEIKNYFLWDKYNKVIELGEKYIGSENTYELPEIVDRVALSYFRLDKMDLAREYFGKLKLIESYEDYAQFQMGETYYNDKDYLKAAEEYKKVAENGITPEYKEKGFYWEVNSIYNTGKYGEYTEKAKEFLKLYPNSQFKDNILILNGEVLAREGSIESQIKNYEDLYSNTQNPLMKEDALIKIIQLNDKNNSYDKGLEWVDKLSNKEQQEYFKSKFYMAKGETEKALESYGNLLSSNEYKDYALISLGNYWYGQNNLQKAKEYYGEISNLDTSEYKDLAAYQLANIYEKEGDYALAARNYVKVYVMYPQSKYTLESEIKAGENYEKINRYKEALDQYKEAYKKNNKSYEKFLLEKMIFLNLKIENKEEAKVYYEKLVKLDEKSSEKYKEFIIGGTN